MVVVYSPLHYLFLHSFKKLVTCGKPDPDKKRKRNICKREAQGNSHGNYTILHLFLLSLEAQQAAEIFFILFIYVEKKIPLR